MARSEHDRGSKEHDAKIAAMFDKVAPRYDRLNRILSLGNDRGWRRRAVIFARLGPGELALDVGVGTGDLSFDLLEASDPTSRIVGIDLSEAMLARSRERAAAHQIGSRFEARLADAQALPYPDASFDRVVTGFAVRNFGDIEAGLREMRRVLRPGGRAVILEFSTPPLPFVRIVADVYLHGLVPRIAAAFGGDPEAYRYLPRSIARFPAAEGLAALMREGGFARVRFERLAMGVIAIHVADA